MSCGYSCAKWLLFIFNFIFTLCGLAILITGILIHLKIGHVSQVLEQNVSFPTLGLIIIGAIIFTVAFFGCCGAIRESHCMIITFAMLLLTILIIQVAIGVYAFVKLKGFSSETIREPYSKAFYNYRSDESDKELIDWSQSTFECCGVESPRDWDTVGTKPWSCCAHENDDDRSVCTKDYYQDGCLKKISTFVEYAGVLLGSVAIGIAAIELIGIIFALCLANSIRNAERRGYRV